MLFREIRNRRKKIAKEEIGKIIGVIKFREGFYNYWQVFFRGEEIDFMIALEEQCLTTDEDEDFERPRFNKN